jgi:catechol 2,3-dioxygenase-like lactoylglutathione lyase family enzyme
VLHGVWHFSFTVSDLDRSVAFYTGQLGFELIHTQEQSNDYTRKLVGQPRGLSSHDLELVQYLQPRGTRGEAEICNPGAAHLALTVDDIHTRYEKLTAAGVRFYSPPNAITAGINAGGFTCYLEDPDQIVLELVQPPAHRLHPDQGEAP